MCRESERGTVQNIFTGQFLERLRGLRADKIKTNVAVTDESPKIIGQTTDQATNSEDEFLGVVGEPITEQATAQGSQNLTRDISSQTVDSSGIAETAAKPVPVETTETNSSDSLPEKPENSKVSEIAEIETAKKETEVDVKAAAGVCLPEKEPYQFDKCTVTATVQLLPIDENSEIRRVVLSVRTHDFAPQISMVEISRNNLPLALTPEIEKVLAKYKSDLPFKVMDKMKKEKSTPKKSVAKSAIETKTVSQETPKTKEISPTQNVQTAPTENNSPVVQPPPMNEPGGQGSLFSF
jgi:hypothetical protein